MKEEVVKVEDASTELLKVLNIKLNAPVDEDDSWISIEEIREANAK